MKITNVKTLVVNAEMRNWVFVKVETDQAGLYGWGEASLEWKTRAVVGAVEDFAPMLLGEDPERIEFLYQKMYRQSFWRLGVIGLSAISGIGLRGRIVGTADLVSALRSRLHMEVTERTLRNWARAGQITAHVPFGPIEDPGKPRRAWWFDLGAAIEDVAMMYRECAMCSGPLRGRGTMCLRCLATMHDGPIFLAEKPAYVVGSVAPASPPPLPMRSLDERVRCDLTDMPVRWCGCATHRGS